MSRARRSAKIRRQAQRSAPRRGTDPGWVLMAAVVGIGLAAMVMVIASRTESAALRTATGAAAPAAGISAVAVEAAIAADPRIVEVASKFNCPCGTCGVMELVDCTCDVAGGALEVKAAIADMLNAGISPEDVVGAVAARYGALKPDPGDAAGAGATVPAADETTALATARPSTTTPATATAATAAGVDAFTAVVARFDCRCGTCSDALADCSCTGPRGATEVKTFIRKRLGEGRTASEVAAEVASLYGTRAS